MFVCLLLCLLASHQKAPLVPHCLLLLMLVQLVLVVLVVLVECGL